MRREVAIYLLVWALGLTAAAVCLHSLAIAPVGQPWVVALSLGAFMALFKRVRLSSHDYYSYYSLEDVPLFAMVYLFGAPVAALVAGLTKLGYELVKLIQALGLHPDRVRPVLVLYRFTNAPALTVSIFLSASAYQALNQAQPLLGSPRNGLAILAGALVFFLTAFSLNSLLLMARRGGGAGQFWAALDQDLALIQVQVLMLAPLGALLGLFVQAQPVGAILLVVPVILMHVALDARYKLVREAQNTIQAMVQYLDERDHYTLGHSQRVSGYAAAVATELGLSATEVDRARRAGLIHDIGKIDIPDAVLRKPGALTQDERAIMRTHTDRAAELGRKLVALKNDLPFYEAAYHHETYDGLGSIFGLKGEKIPLVARILAVVDSYDAMTSDRPYRAGISAQDAIARLEGSRGTQHDPRVVDAFVRAFRRGAIQAVAEGWSREEAERRRFVPARPDLLSVGAGSC